MKDLYTLSTANTEFESFCGGNLNGEHESCVEVGAIPGSATAFALRDNKPQGAGLELRFTEAELNDFALGWVKKRGGGLVRALAWLRPVERTTVRVRARGGPSASPSQRPARADKSRGHEEPRVYERGTTALDETITPDFLRDYLFTGCVSADEIAVVKAPNPSLNKGAFMTNGRSDAAKLRRLHDSGHTIRLGNLQRVLPYMAHVSQRIQEETGYSNYVHALLTPPGHQGLRHHWDQQMAVIVQTAGVKRWHLWRPPVEAPMREFNESWRVWRDDYVPTWQAQGPDIELDLEAGQSLLLPRGWVHNPHVADSEETSVHLTFALRERTPLWLAEKLVAGVIAEGGFRRVIRPGQLEGAELGRQLLDTRDALVQYLAGLDVTEAALAVRQAAMTELEYTT